MATMTTPSRWKDKSRSARSHAWLILGFFAVQAGLGAAMWFWPEKLAHPAFRHPHATLGCLIGLIAIGWLVVLRKRRAVVPVSIAPKIALAVAVAFQVALGWTLFLKGRNQLLIDLHWLGAGLLLAAIVWLTACCVSASRLKDESK